MRTTKTGHDYKGEAGSTTRSESRGPATVSRETHVTPFKDINARLLILQNGELCCSSGSKKTDFTRLWAKSTSMPLHDFIKMCLHDASAISFPCIARSKLQVLHRRAHLPIYARHPFAAFKCRAHPLQVRPSQPAGGYCSGVAERRADGHKTGRKILCARWCVFFCTH